MQKSASFLWKMCIRDSYQTDIQNNMLAKYQYMLSVPTSAMSGNKISSLFSLLEYSLGAKTENEDAEEFSAYSLNTTPKTFKSEEVTLYGVKMCIRDRLWMC